jgi:uncharacterized membrane protein YphA (DoxX/SURF4 family)
MIVPRWPADSPAYTVLVYVGSLALMAAGLAIVFNKRAREACLWLGGVLLALLLFSYVPYELLYDPYYYHIALWTNAFKELAFAGGAFVIAGTCTVMAPYRSPVLRFLEKLIPAGRWFFAITMATFGCMHWLYLENIAASLVPAWMPYHTFWTGFTGICLIGAGLSIALNIKTWIVANLLGLMIMLWFFMVHVPRAVAMPFQDDGNEVTAAFSALAFCGTALVIANVGRVREGTEV